LKPNISEFSFGYAFVEHIARTPGLPFAASPVFPSLIREGELGYDVELISEGVPLFLQFKLSDCLVKRNAKEEPNLGVPYFRMHIRSLRHSEQHRLLLDLENDGELVYYVAPMFHQPNELNDAYLAHEVLLRSMIIEPSAIGHLTINEEHYLAFNNNRDVIVCSKPRKIEKRFAETNYFVSKVEEKVIKWQKSSKSDDIDILLGRLVEMIGQSKQRGFWDAIEPTKLLSDRPPLFQIAYLARMFLDCEFLIVKGRII